MKLQILIPQYKETDKIIKPLLDSIELQQAVNLATDIGVIIVNDGTDVYLSDTLLSSYSYQIDYYKHKHKGVSATRNACLDYATADYIMFCDADDMFYNLCALHIIFREIDKKPFDTFVSKFIEEIRIGDKAEFIDHDLDSTFVHGKVHRRKYLIDNNIRWNEDLTLHEDAYFHILCQQSTSNIVYCDTSFYLWKFRADSICRSDPHWVMNTYDHLIKANSALVSQLVERKLEDIAAFYTATLLIDAYSVVNTTSWHKIVSEEHTDSIIKLLRDYYIKYNYLFERLSTIRRDKLSELLQTKIENIPSLKCEISFKQWINNINNF